MLLDAHSDRSDELIPTRLSMWVFFPLRAFYHVVACLSRLNVCVCVCVRACACVCVCAYLAVKVRGVYTGFDDIEQRVNQALTSAHLFSCLLTSWTQVPFEKKNTHTAHTNKLGLWFQALLIGWMKMHTKADACCACLSCLSCLNKWCGLLSSPHP